LGTGTWDVGLGDAGTRGRGDAGTRGRGDVGTWGLGDMGREHAWSIHCGGHHFQVLCEFFSLPQIPKTVQLSAGKNSAKYNAYSYIECVLAVIFAGYIFHSLLGSVGKLSAETNFNFPAPPSKNGCPPKVT